jgi:hypothetical protein
MKYEQEVLALLRDIKALLSDQRVEEAPSRRTRSPKRMDRDASPATAVSKLLESRDDAAGWAAIWDHGSALDRWLAVLAIAEDEIGPQTALSASEVARVVTDRFRVSGVHATNVNRDLKRARKYVGRRSRGGTFEYWLTRNGLAYIQARPAAIGERTRGAPLADGRPPKRKRSGKTAGKRPREAIAVDEMPAPAATRRRATGSTARPGPQRLVEDLLAAGYFSEGRTISDIQEHLERRMARRLKATDISPILTRLIRRAQIEREKNQDGIYEYQAP